MTRNRPFGVTLLLWLVLTLITWGAVRVSASLRGWAVLDEYGSSLSPLYFLVTGAGWGVAGGVILFGLWSRKAWIRPAFIASIVIWMLEYWIERTFFQSPRANLIFALACSVVVIIVAAILTILPGTISFFAKSEEHEQPDQKSASE